MLPDRHIAVPPYHIIKTGYVDVFKVRLACRERMSKGDVGEAFEKLIQLAPNQPHPAPFGHWDEHTFVIEDGRHQWIASIMLGYPFILVCWLEKIEGK